MVLHITADIFISMAYFSIPVALIYFLRRRKDLKFKAIFVLFAAFILSCGLTHLFSIYTIWRPDYWTEGYLKLITGLISIVTALSLWPLIPLALKVPSHQQLENINLRLQEQIEQREKAELQLQQLNEILKENLDEKTREAHEAGQEVQKMREEVVSVCAWTKRVLDEGQWVSFEEYLQNHLDISFSHGISKEALIKEKAKVEAKTKRPKTAHQETEASPENQSDENG